ncbi:hypothetical protein ACW7BJ_27215 [Azospirillum argentinense]
MSSEIDPAKLQQALNAIIAANQASNDTIFRLIEQVDKNAKTVHEEVFGVLILYASLVNHLIDEKTIDYHRYAEVISDARRAHQHLGGPEVTLRILQLAERLMQHAEPSGPHQNPEDRMRSILKVIQGGRMDGGSSKSPDAS